MKKILLVNPHQTEQLGFTNPPLGLLYLAGTLIKHGFDVKVADGCREGIAAVQKAIVEFCPDIVGITSLTPGRKKALEIAKMAKEIIPSAKVIMGGVHPTIMYDQMFKHYPYIDYIAIGEGEQTILELAQEKAISEINGLVYKKSREIIVNPARKYIADLDSIPFPAWHLVDLRKYQARGEGIFRGINLSVEPRISVIFSRGCSGHCNFCSTWWIWKGWRHRSARNMVDELELLYHNHRIKHFCFADDALTVDRQATIDLCNEIIDRKLNIAFHVTTRTDCVDEIVLNKLHEAGCYEIAFGVETASQSILDKIKKKNEVANAANAIALSKKAGITTTALMISGNVGENKDTITETVQFLRKTQPDVVGCAGALWIFPGTKLYHDCKDRGFIDDSFWLGDEPYKIYTLEWSLEQLKIMHQMIMNYNVGVQSGANQVTDATTPSVKFLDKWKKYVNIEANEYSATTLWPDAQAQHRELMAKIPQHCRNVLDLGCGDGWSTQALIKQGKKAVGLTINHREAVHARTQYGLELAVHDMHDLPFPDKSFDAVYCRECYEHSVAPYIALCEMNRVLGVGGYAIINLPWDDWIREDSHYSVFSPSQMREMFYKCRFVVEDEGRTSFGHFWYLARKAAEIGEPHPYKPPVPGQKWMNGLSGNPAGGRQDAARPKIVAMMRIKNEGRWIKEVLDSIATVAGGIVILDDGSTDCTPEICKAHRAVIDYHFQQEGSIDEVRDKNKLLKMVLAHNPEWVLAMDGDEVFEDSARERIYEAIAKCPDDVSTMDFEFLYMWNDLRHYRIDGIYNRIYHHRLFKLKGQNSEKLTFTPTSHGSNFHCESVPRNLTGKSIEVDVKIKHLGYMYRQDRINKYRWYTKNDPAHAANGYYEHLLDQPGMVIETWRERPFSPSGQGGASRVSSSRSKQESKPVSYYANARDNLARLVPPRSKRVLDVGCGQGLTGALLRSSLGAEVVGIEIHEEIAREASKHLDRVLTGDIEEMDLPFETGYFDCIILADVLEHLIDPWATLRKLVRYLNPEGAVIASIPNIRNLAVVKTLLDGSWRYEEQGILDRTHLRFFALSDMVALFEQAGITAAVREVVPDPRFNEFMKQFTKDSGTKNNFDITLGNLVLKNISSEELSRLTAQQFIFVGSPKSAAVTDPFVHVQSRQPLVSIIIPVYNNLEYTRQCVASIYNVKEGLDFEVIVVDDASGDGTGDFLAGNFFPLRAITNPHNLGFARSCNAGAHAAHGKYLVFLNNDTVVTPGWLRAMTSCMQRDPAIGLVGNLQIYPDSGKVQHAGIVCGDNNLLYSIYNNQLSGDHPAVNKSRQFQFVAGSCLLMEKGLFFQLGGFDEAYKNSCEDVDLCMKVRQSGRKVYYCAESKIFHFESKTVKNHSKTSSNYGIFLQRWGDKIVRDDLKYLCEDGFAKESAPMIVPGDVRPHEVVLIAPPRYFPSPGLCAYTGLSKNLGLAYIAGLLKQNGIKVSIIDAFAMGIDKFVPVDLANKRVYRCGASYEQIAQAIPGSADLIGISVPFTNVAGIAAELAAFLKSRLPSKTIVLGGVHPSTFPEESMTEGVDIVVRGEGEVPMLLLARGEKHYQIPDIYYRNPDGSVASTTQTGMIQNLDALSFPAWDLLPMDLYGRISPRGNRANPALSLITSRGCPFSCNFCSIHPVAGSRWRARSPENVLAEIRLAHTRYGIEHIEIEDDNFTIKKDRAIAILKGLTDISPGLTWAAHNGVRIDTLDEELLSVIKQSGCVQLNLAVEHGSKRVLKAMNKNLSLDKVKEIVEICGRLQINTLGFCLVGYPGETDECFEESFLFYRELKRLGLTTIAPFIVNAYPGTALYKQAKTNGWLHPATERQLFFLEDEFVSVITPEFDEKKVRLRKKAMELLNVYPEIEFQMVSKLLN